MERLVLQLSKIFYVSLATEITAQQPFFFGTTQKLGVSEAGKICIILYHIPMSPPLNKYKNNPEKQTRAAINILPYIRNNALYLLFGSIYITLTFILLHQLKQGKKCKWEKVYFGSLSNWYPDIIKTEKLNSSSSIMMMLLSNVECTV